MKSFSEYAQEKLIDLYNNHSNEVGSQLKLTDPVKYKDLESTDCITYSLNVLSHAFQQRGNAAAAKHVWRLGERGTELAKYLVDTHGWKGVYINPDSKHPADADSEHAYSSHLASKTCKYYQVPLTYKIHNYAITERSHSAFQKLNKSAPVTKLNTVGITSLDRIKFGFGLSRGGLHAWVYSEGKVYEVHWDGIGSSLYEATPIRNFPWLSGIVVIPADEATKLEASAKLKCETK